MVGEAAYVQPAAGLMNATSLVPGTQEARSGASRAPGLVRAPASTSTSVSSLAERQ